MAYELIKSDNTFLLNLVDGTKDTSKTDITLIGKNSSGFGQAINQNFVKILENFASVSQPTHPLEGQIWYDKSEGRLKVYSATGWRGANGTIVQSSQPYLTTGDIWIDSSQKKMYFYDGTNIIEAAKQWEDSQNKTGTIAETIKDSSGNPHSALFLYVNGVLLGIYSADSEFTVEQTNDTLPVSKIPGFNVLSQGFNANSLLPKFTFDTIVSKSKYLIDDDANLYKATNFLKSTADGDTALGPITIQNDNGLILGSQQIANFKISSIDLILENTAPNGSIIFKTSNTQASSTVALYIDSTNNRIGINTSEPTASLEVNGTAVVSGAVTVNGPLVMNGLPRLPTLTTEERDALSPENGSIIYNVDLQKIQAFVGKTDEISGTWVNLNEIN